LRRSIDNRELLMPRYFFDIKDGRRLVDPSGLDCLDDADAISKGEAKARQIEADDSVDMDPQRHVVVINEEGQQIGKIAVHRAPGRPAGKELV
jgi:hypothetical protein